MGDIVDYSGNSLNLDKPIEMSEELTSLMDFINNDLSKELPTLNIDLNYFMLGVLAHKNNDFYKRLYGCMTTSALDSMYNTWYQVVSSKALSALKSNRTPSLDASLKEILAQAKNEAQELGENEVTSEHVLLAILDNNDENNKIRKVFNKAGITYGIMKSKISSGESDMSGKIMTQKIQLPNGATGEVKFFKASSEEEAKELMQRMMNEAASAENLSEFPIPGVTRKKKGKNQFINQYCTNLNELAKAGKIEPLIGREKEIDEIIRILGRKKKNNAILLGGEGVGKTAIAESIAYKIVEGSAPDFLLNRVVVSLDMTALMAGTTLRGMFEERVKGVLDDVKSDPSFIVFIDNIGAVFADKGKNDYEISSMMSRALESGEMQVIGTSDFASYRKTFDKDPSLARRFQKIIIEAPSEKESIDILNGLKESYEKFHKVKYENDAIEACVSLAFRYISERNLPDSAIDLMDEIGAYVGTIQEPKHFGLRRAKIKKLENEIESLKKIEKFEDADMKERELIPIKKRYNDEKAHFDEFRKNNRPVITKNDILELVSRKTGIPVSNLNADDRKKLIDMNERIKEGVIGQDSAIDTICKALKRNRVGLHKNGCMYSFMAIGKTGVGKTLIAKKLAKELFGDEKALVRFDMSEYSDKVSVNKLIGSNPGYVGYEEGGQLTETIKNKKHCVLLLDEIEKADPEVYNIFLQVLDEGFLTDNSGMKVDFKNVIIVFTSNVGAKNATDFSKGIGFNEDESENTKKILLKQLRNRFPPEFINRLDDVIYFNPLKDDDLKEIVKIEIGKFEKNLSGIGYGVKYGDDVVNYILDIAKEEKEYGARPITRAIQDNVENKITDAILAGDYNNGYVFTIVCNNNEIVVS